jgi:hypothetical protein
MFVHGGVAVDSSDLPVVMLTEQGPQARAVEFLQAFERLLASTRERFVSIHDVRTVHGWDLPDRVIVHDWLNKHTPQLAKQVLAHSTVVNGIKQRTMAGAVFWGTKFEQNVTCFENLAEAKTWAHALALSKKR